MRPMYCERTYKCNTSDSNQERLRRAVLSFNENKENLYTATFRSRMNENHYSRCSKCFKDSYIQALQINVDRCKQGDNFCADCTKNQKVGNHYANDFRYAEQDYITVFNPRRSSMSSNSTRGSMYGCDQINVQDVPLNKDVNKSRLHGTCGSQRPENSTVSSKSSSVSSETWSSKHRDESDTTYHPVNPAKLSRILKKKTAVFGHRYHEIDDISDSDSNEVVVNSKTSGATTKAKSKQAKELENDQRTSSANVMNVKSVNADGKDASTGAYQNTPVLGSAENESKIYASANCTDGKAVSSNHGKRNNVDPVKEDCSMASKDDPFQKEDISKENSHLSGVKPDTKRACNEDFSSPQENVGFQKEYISVKNNHSSSTTEADSQKTCKDELFEQKADMKKAQPEAEEAPQRARCKLTRGSRKLPRRRAQRKRVHHPAPVSDNLESGGLDEWLPFVLDYIGQG